jgi:hypothetical protein
MTRKDLNAHLFGPGPKRILGLDGGGIRGILTLQLLTRIEKLVRERTGDGIDTAPDVGGEPLQRTTVYGCVDKDHVALNE